MPIQLPVHRALFRRQALLRQSAPRLGAVLPGPPGARLFAPLAIGLLAAVGALLFASHTRTVMVSGVLRPRLGIAQVTVAQSGIVTQLHVVDGQHVAEGAALLVLSNERASPAGDAAREITWQLQKQRDSVHSELRERRQQEATQRQGQRQQQLALQSAQWQLAQQLQLQLQRVELAEVTASRYGVLQQQGFVPELQWQDRQAELLDQQQRLAELQRAASANRAQLAAVELALHETTAQAARETQALLRNLASIEAQISDGESRRELIVKAPIAGVVDAVAAERGQSVAINQVLLALLPDDSPLEAELYVPAAAAGFLHSGAPVSLRYDAFAYQKFGQQRGAIREISRSTVPRGTAAPVYRVRVALERQSIAAYGQPVPLKPGMSLQAGIQLETRRLYEWLLSPLYSLRSAADGR